MRRLATITILVLAAILAPLIMPCNATIVSATDPSLLSVGDEIVGLRQENSKTFQIEGTQRQIVVSMGAVHYKDNYANETETWKNIDLTWEGNKITKAPYELTLEGNKVTIRDKKSGDVSTIELLDIGFESIPKNLEWNLLQDNKEAKAKIPDIVLDTDLEIVTEFGAVRVTRILKSDKAPLEATFRVTGNFRVRASDADGDLSVETTLIDGILIETLKPDRPVKYPVRIDPTWQVGGDEGSTDDCTRNTVTTDFFSTTYSALYLGYSSPSYPSRGSAARFLNVAIPAGSTIVSAALILTARGSHTATVVKSRIRAELNLTPVTFVDAADFDARTWTTEFINWDDIDAWTADVEYTSPDFKDVLQEVADLGAITHLVILWDDFEQRSDQVNSHYRNSHSYDSSTTLCPQLVTTYTVPPVTVTNSNADIDSTMATLNGNITATGDGDCTERGFVWDTSTHADPGDVAPPATYANSWTEVGSFGIGAFDYDAEGLTELTTYYYRACAEAGGTGGWDYSDEREFFIGEEGKVYREINPVLNIDTIRAAGVPTGLHVGEIFFGFSLPIWSDTAQVNEELHFQVEVPDWWAGESDIIIHLHTATTGDESGNTYGVQLSHSHSTHNVVEAFPVGVMHSETTNRLVGSALTYAHYMEVYVVAYDHEPTDPMIADDVMGFRIRRVANETQGDELDGELIIIDCVEVYFAYVSAEEIDVITIIEEWMEENMEEIGIQLGLFNDILEGWSVFLLIALGMIFIFGFSFLAFWKPNPVLFMLLAGASIIFGLFWFNVYTSYVGLAAALLLIIYSFVCCGYAFKSMFRAGKGA